MSCRLRPIRGAELETSDRRAAVGLTPFEWRGGARVKHRRPQEKLQLPQIDVQRLRQLLPEGRQWIDFAIGTALVAGCVVVLFRLRQIGGRAKALVSDGSHVFAPGQLVRDQAWVAMQLTLISLVVVVVIALVARKRSANAVLGVVFAVICFSALMTVFITFQQYRGFLHG
jgi:hypothetical protein